MQELSKNFCKQIIKKFRGRKINRPVYVIQEHTTKRGTHYDLRLEMNKVLESWAVPKNPKLSDKKKLLAIFTTPHAIEYALFHGRIPEGNPGAGIVKIFDRGTYDLLGKGKGKVVFKLKGKKLRGEYCLINFKRDGKNWLFFKK